MATRNKYTFEELILLFEVHVLYPGYRSVEFWQFVQNNLIPLHPWISIRDKYRRLKQLYMAPMAPEALIKVLIKICL